MQKWVVLFLSLALFACGAFAQNPDEWSWFPIVNATNAPPTQLTKASAALVNHTMVIFGGFSSDALTGDTHAFDIANLEWNVKLNVTLSPIARSQHGAVVDDLSMLTYGGISSEGVLLNDVWRFNLASNDWSLVAAGGDSPRCADFGAAAGGRQSDAAGSGSSGLKGRQWYIFGGRCTTTAPFYQNETTLSNTLFTIDVDTGVVTTIVPHPDSPVPTARAGHSTLVYKNQLLVYGGYSEVNGTVVLLNDLWSYHAGINTWTQITYSADSVPAPKVQNHISFVINDNLFVFGGKSDNKHSHGNVYQFDLVNGTWTMPVASEEPTTSELEAAAAVLYANDTVYTLLKTDVSPLWVLSTLPPAGLEWYYVVAIVGGSVVIITGIIFAIYCVVSRRDSGYTDME